MAYKKKKTFEEFNQNQVDKNHEKDTIKNFEKFKKSEFSLTALAMLLSRQNAF